MIFNFIPCILILSLISHVYGFIKFNNRINFNTKIHSQKSNDEKIKSYQNQVVSKGIHNLSS